MSLLPHTQQSDKLHEGATGAPATGGEVGSLSSTDSAYIDLSQTDASLSPATLLLAKLRLLFGCLLRKTRKTNSPLFSHVHTRLLSLARRPLIAHYVTPSRKFVLGWSMAVHSDRLGAFCHCSHAPRLQLLITQLAVVGLV